MDGSMAPLPCKSPMVPSCGSKVLSALNFNEMNKRSVIRDSAEDFKSRRGFGVRGAFRKNLALSNRLVAWTRG